MKVKLWAPDGDYVEDIRATDPHRHKYGDAMAEYLDVVAMARGGPDDETGDVEWVEHVMRFGKRLVFTDDRGFVASERWPTEQAARERFNEIESDYLGWLDHQDDAE